MCQYYCRCDCCAADKSECEEMGDGTPFCHYFQCTMSSDQCKRFECISYEEEFFAYHPDL